VAALLPDAHPQQGDGVRGAHERIGGDRAVGERERRDDAGLADGHHQRRVEDDLLHRGEVVDRLGVGEGSLTFSRDSRLKREREAGEDM
jgi:hypothetical protein